MLKGILSISGRPGLFKLVNHGKNMLIVESLLNGKRTPAYAHDKVISLADVSIYTLEDDKPLAEVFELVKAKNDGKQVDVKAIGNDAALRAYFGEILPDFDQERVYTNDIKKLLSWYNQLIAAGMDQFVEPEQNEEATEATENTADTQDSK